MAFHLLDKIRLKMFLGAISPPKPLAASVFYDMRGEIAVHLTVAGDCSGIL